MKFSWNDGTGEGEIALPEMVKRVTVIQSLILKGWCYVCALKFLVDIEGGYLSSIAVCSFMSQNIQTGPRGKS